MKDNNGILKAIGMITQIGISMITPIILCTLIGGWIDRKVGTSFWLLIFLILGIVTSFRNVYFMTKQFYAKEKEKEDQELNYFRDLKQQGEQSKSSNDTSKHV